MNVLTFLVVAAVLATIAVLASGVVSMMHGGAADLEHGNAWMWKRVALQGVAFALIAAALLFGLA